MLTQITPGSRLPSVTLAQLNGDKVQIVHSDRLFAGKRVVVVGVVGAFTPVCTKEHMPAFVTRAHQVRELGFDMIVCIAPNDPWTVNAWAQQTDPNSDVQFLSDGNLSLARRLGVTFEAHDLFIGKASRRYLLLLNDGIVEHLNVEPTPTELTCTRVDDIPDQVVLRVEASQASR